MSKNAIESYYAQEEKNGFKNWTPAGLRFLIKNKTDELTLSQLNLAQKRLDKIGT